jgi:hypothetical protein
MSHAGYFEDVYLRHTLDYILHETYQQMALSVELRHKSNSGSDNLRQFLNKGDHVA